MGIMWNIFMDSGALNEDELRELYGKIGNSFYDNMDDMDDEYQI